MSRFKIKGERMNGVPIIGQKSDEKKAQEATMQRIIKTTPAVVAVCACGTESIGEGVDVLSSALGNLLAQGYPNNRGAAEAMAASIQKAVLEVYDGQLKSM